MPQPDAASSKRRSRSVLRISRPRSSAPDNAAERRRRRRGAAGAAPIGSLRDLPTARGARRAFATVRSRPQVHPERGRTSADVPARAPRSLGPTTRTKRRATGNATKFATSRRSTSSRTRTHRRASPRARLVRPRARRARGVCRDRGGQQARAACSASAGTRSPRVSRGHPRACLSSASSRRDACASRSVDVRGARDAPVARAPPPARARAAPRSHPVRAPPSAHAHGARAGASASVTACALGAR